MALHRRRVLGSAAALFSASGCLGSASSGGDGRSADDENSTADASPAESPCEVAAALPSAADGPSYPTHPESVSPAAAETFALDFEAAYQRNDVLSSNTDPTYLTAKSRVVERSDPVENGFVVALRLDMGYGFPQSDEGGRETAVTVHADYAAYATYFVGPTRTLRVETNGQRDADPRTASGGAVVTCSEPTTPS